MGAMLIGYMRVSKADGSQSTDLQDDALIVASVSPAHLYEDPASGRRDDRPGLAACLKALREGAPLIVWKLDRARPRYASSDQHRVRPDSA
jgi:DNA invertase Pin-like site-specific DNA recombinase